jgi:hypothetical protein
MIKEEKEERIKAEIKRVRKIFANIPHIDKKKRILYDDLLNNIAFMRVSMEEAKDLINANGVCEPYTSGSNTFLREHPAVKVFTTFSQRYLATIKQVIDMLPPDKQPETEDKLMAFLRETPIRNARI